MTDLAYLRDAYVTTLESTVTAVDGLRVATAATILYPTGGGQPHDTGTIAWSLGTAVIESVRKEDGSVWHTLAADSPVPEVGHAVTLTVDWERRHQLMRTHTAMHILCGVIWNEYGKPVTGGDMQPLSARMDFEFDPLPDGFAETVERRVNEEIRADRQIVVSFLPRETAVVDADLIRTKVSLIPDSASEIRIVEIVGLDKQADGGTHVRSTKDVGVFKVIKTESKGKGNKRIRIELHDA